MSFLKFLASFLAACVSIHCINGQMMGMPPPPQGGPRMIPQPLQPMMAPLPLQRSSRQQSAPQSQSCRINVQSCGLRAGSTASLEPSEPGLKYVNSHDVPWQVAIRVQPTSTAKPWFCSGVIINENWVLCPAYCLYHKRPGDLATKTITIAAGVANPFTNSTAFTKISSYSIHASYSGTKTKGFDIALIKSSVEFPLNSNGPINAICLPEAASSEIEIGPVKCTGWPGLGINNLVITNSFSDSIDRCVGVNTHELPHELCSMSQSPPDCQLDVGSPCFRSLPSPIPVQSGSPVVLVGMLSKKVTCRKPNSPNSFSTARLTRVSFFNEWIADTIGACQGQRVTVTSVPGAITVTRGSDAPSTTGAPSDNTEGDLKS